ncbi:hypothetical protein QFZ31_005231 [Neobacillus niacini]|jgi:hypothetical protein|uniref:lasso peptide biosynthesis PqqD family chaperone n=1 Tax=Neobacillus driksii TaxID=3035913 RepID=UPI002782ACF3|nr:lasso peptide biosynthesis PqqD family chaperone [Neobacillus niacini]MDQ0975353.1 hypothetical protein [Neobacillus niacini]
MIKEKLTLNSRISQENGNIVSNMDGDKVMMNINKGKYYNLHTIGGEIWDLIEKPIYIQQIIDELLAKYNVERLECTEQVLLFLEKLNDEGLIKILAGTRS